MYVCYVGFLIALKAFLQWVVLCCAVFPGLLSYAWQVMYMDRAMLGLHAWPQCIHTLCSSSGASFAFECVPCVLIPYFSIGHILQFWANAALLIPYTSVLVPLARLLSGGSGGAWWPHCGVGRRMRPSASGLMGVWPSLTPCTAVG